MRVHPLCVCVLPKLLCGWVACVRWCAHLSLAPPSHPMCPPPHAHTRTLPVPAATWLPVPCPVVVARACGPWQPSACRRGTVYQSVCDHECACVVCRCPSELLGPPREHVVCPCITRVWHARLCADSGVWLACSLLWWYFLGATAQPGGSFEGATAL